MKIILAILLFAMGSVATADELQGNGVDWPGFRGPGGRGISSGYKTAGVWDTTNPDDPATLWRTEVPGLGHASPTIYGDKIFLATAVSASDDPPLQIGRGGNTAAADDNGEQTWLVLCYDKATGKELWRKEACQGKPKATRHTKATHANSTIAVDAEHVIAFFGAEGCYCFDHDGNLLWDRDLGAIDISKYGIGWGYASSPAIHGDRVVLVCDDPKAPFLAALQLSDGQELWRKSREGDCERSWGTALIHESEDGAQVVVNGWPWIVSYDLASGNERWRIKGGGDNPTPTPFAIHDRIFITNAHGGPSPIYVIDSGARGNLSQTDAADASESDAGEPDANKSADSQAVADASNDETASKDVASSPGVIWKVDRGGSYMSTPVVWGDYLYLGNTNGVVRCFHAETGEKIYEQRLGSKASITASLVAADDKIYCPSENGKMYVLSAGPEFQILSENPMGEPCFATPALSEGTLFVRTTKALYAIQPEK